MDTKLRIATLVLAQAGGAVGEHVGDWIASRLEDPGQALAEAVRRAQEGSWQVLELALAGERLGSRFRLVLSSGQIKGLVAPVERVLESRGPELREQCLRELRDARRAGVLVARLGPPDPADSASLKRFDDPQGFVAAAWTLVRELSGELRRSGYPNLSILIGSESPGQPPLLVTAFGYLLRRELSDDPKLASELSFDLLQRVWAGQERGLGELHDSLDTWGQALGEELDRVAAGLSKVETRVGETFDAVLDLRRVTEGAQGEVRELARQVLGALDRLGAARGSVKPGLSCSIRSDAERALVRGLIERYRALPEGQRGQVPALLNGLGKLELAAGETRGAQQTFGELAERVSADGAALAEARYNQYRAALESRDWSGALPPLLAAAELDPARFAPFPLRKFQPLEVLGAGGFGVAFLCRHRHIDAPVVIKTLYADELNQGIAQIFREGQLLKTVSHPAVVRVEDCDYADAEGLRRPYLVMEHFPGQSLDDWLAQYGPLAVPDLLELAGTLAAGMQAAHARGVLHRDLKPDNLLVRRNGNWHVKIIDFGLALKQQPGEPAATTAPTSGQPGTTGTPQFAPPEQTGRRREPIGPYSDIYSFGKTLVYCVFRRTELLRRDWRALEEAKAGLPELIERCLEEDPAQRFQDFAAVAQALAALRSSGETRLAGSQESALAAATAPPLPALTQVPAPVSGPAPATARAQSPASPPQPARGWQAPDKGGPTAAPAGPAGWAGPGPKIDGAGWAELACLGNPSGHRDGVEGLAFSPDGGTLYSASKDGPCFAWGVADGQVRRVLPGGIHISSYGSGLAITPDGRRLLAHSLGGVNIVSADDSNQRTRISVGGTHRLLAFALDPEGKRLVTADGDQRLCVWDLESAALLRECTGDTPLHSTLVVLRDGRTALAAGKTTIRAWDLEEGRELWQMECVGEAPNRMLVSRDETTLVALFGAGMPRTYDLPSRTLRKQWPAQVSSASAVLASDGSGLLAGGYDGQIRLYDLDSGELKGTLFGHTAAVTALALSPDGSILASAGQDCSVRTWDLASGHPIWSPPAGHTGPVKSLALARDGTALASGSQDNTVRLWDLTARTECNILSEPGDGSIAALAMTGDGTRIAWSTHGGRLNVWDLQSETRLMRVFISLVTRVALTDGGQHLWTLIGGNPSMLRLWDMDTAKGVRDIPLPAWGIALALTADERRACVACNDKTVALWDLDQGQAIWSYTCPTPGQLAAMAMTADGSRVALADHQGKIYLVAVEGAIPERQIAHGEPVVALQFSPAGDLLYCAGRSGALIARDPETGKPQRALEGHLGPANAIAFEASGRFAVSGGDDGTLRLWGPS